MRRSQTGLTLVELLITMLIAAVIGSMAIPSFNNLVKENRVTTQTNEFVGSLVLARMEAIKRKVNIDVVADNGNNWDQGWHIMVNNGETLQVFSKFKGGTTLTSAAGRNVFQFDPNGRVNHADSLTLCTPQSQIKGRSISISNTGRVSTQTVSCT